MKKITYVIHVNPTQTRELVVMGGRRKPRKLRLHQVREFNKLVKTGKLRGLRFDGQGVFQDAEADFETMPKKDLETIRKIVLLSQSELLKNQKCDADIERGSKFLKTLGAHARRGHFEWLPFSLESVMIQKAGSARSFLAHSERINKHELPELRRLVEKFGSWEKAEKNLRVQLRYFGALLAKQKKIELVVYEEDNEISQITTRFLLEKGNIVKEEASLIKPLGQTEKASFTLAPDGKIRFREIKAENGARRRF